MFQILKFCYWVTNVGIIACLINATLKFMPKKFLQRLTANPEKLKEHKSLQFLGELIHDPNLFHLNKHSVSVAFLVGIFCAFLPILGQMPLAALIAVRLRCNLPLAVALVWISNPITIPPIFLATYKFGSWLLNIPPEPFSIELTWEWFATTLSGIWQPLIVGSVIVATMMSLSSYIIVRIVWRYHVLDRWKKRRLQRLNRKP